MVGQNCPTSGEIGLKDSDEVLKGVPSECVLPRNMTIMDHMINSMIKGLATIEITVKHCLIK